MSERILWPYIEALVFCADEPISEKDLTAALRETLDEDIAPKEVRIALDELREKYEQSEHALELVEIAEGYQFLTKESFQAVVGTYLKQHSGKKLSKAAMETLSIIAYKQPVTKGVVERIRGVNCDYTIQKLLDKELVAIIGREDGPGRPLIYATSDKFMNYFGLKSIDDLPQLKDIQSDAEEVGEPAPVEELETEAASDDSDISEENR